MQNRTIAFALAACCGLVGAAKSPDTAKAPSRVSPRPQAASDAQAALGRVLETVDRSWFGAPYQGVTSVEARGTLGISLGGAAVNQKVDALSQGQVKGNSLGGQANLKISGTYFANGDFKTDLAGDFGNLLYARRGNRGFLFSKEQNAYTTRVDLAPSDSPLTYMAWFRQTLNDIKAVYADSKSFKGAINGTTLIFEAPTNPWDAKKREQTLAQSLGFWKRGRLEVTVDPATNQPQHLGFANDDQGVRTTMYFTYTSAGKLQGVNIANASQGFDGPGWIRVGYGGDGRMANVAGEISSREKRISFALDLAWSKTKTLAEIAVTPPAGATKRGREDLETQIIMGLAAQVFDLQRAGLNLRSPALARGN